MSKRTDKMVSKELHKVTRIVDRYITSFGCNSGGISYDFLCCCHDDENTIFYTVLMKNKADEAFKNFVKEEFNIDGVDIFTLSLLHEVGHIMTQNYLTDSEDSYCNEVKEMLSKQPKWTPSIGNYYWHLADELMATQWACDYIHNNRKEVLHFDNLIKKELKRFYRKCLTE